MMASQTTLEKKFQEFEEAREAPQSSRPKIQKVVKHLRNRNDFEKHFSPKYVSIGPIHHDNQNLRLGQSYKLTWAANYFQHILQTPEFLHRKIADNIYELMSHYTDDVLADTAVSLQGFSSLEEKLSWVLFVDGCFLLNILRSIDPNRLNNENEVNMKVDQLVLVMKDVLLLENQLPYLVLKLLWHNDSEEELIDTMINFLSCYRWTSPVNKRTWWSSGFHEILLNAPPTHLLDFQRKMILTKSNPKMEANNEDMHWREEFFYIESKMMTHRNIQDLTAGGIKLKSSGTRRTTDVGFSEGPFAAELTLPEIIVDDSTATSFLNLIAYEMCPDFENDFGICSFMVFMDSLIDSGEDVRILRSHGILSNLLGKDEQVADLFNTISTDLVYNTTTYFEVRDKIHKHRFNKYKMWLVLGYQKYFSNPWAVIGFIAGSVALVLTFAQTWFTIFPR
ncbi:UPF0481 protein At3g47200-like [Vicia villosa]|uniref:UPF0481 protein At3g47200-like n=1 Tax=Vicia villosa TaxID=3911 RepID=UPI00273C05E4|nr:UPF0481 protein At3g47200-like [Vicia villosa]